MKPAKCHPDRRHEAHGLCRACYQNSPAQVEAQRLRKRAQQPGEHRPVCHPDRRHYARELCRLCYVAKVQRANQLEASRRYTRTPQGYAARVRRRAHLFAATAVPLNPARLAALRSGACFYCGAEKCGGVDHVVPLSRGGAHELANLVGACASCNSSKGAKLLSEWKGPNK